MSTQGIARSALLLAAFVQGGCMPASWGAGGLLHPFRRPLTVARPPLARDFAVDNEGVTLRGWLFRGPGTRRGTVIYLHGSADNRASGLYAAEHFLGRGFDVLTYDSRAHGESGGDACTYGYHEKKDLSRAIDSLPSRPVVLLGVSLGAAVALQAAAEDRRIVAVVAVATFSDLRTVASERAPFFASKANIDGAFRLAEEQGHFVVDDVSPTLAAARIQVPVFLIHGQADTETPPAHSKRVFEALRGEKRFLLAPRAGHNDTLQGKVWDEIDAWVGKALLGTGRRGAIAE